jgi:hypothetical protein
LRRNDLAKMKKTNYFFRIGRIQNLLAVIANLIDRVHSQLRELRMTSQTGRALRGTKTLTRAFFEAAETISADRRPAVVKAALASIREDLKSEREKVKLAKLKSKEAPRKVAKVAAPLAKKVLPRKASAV